MTTKTDYQAISELLKIYTPARRGIISGDEVATVKAALELDARTDIELQNVRDMTVMLLGQLAESYEQDGKSGRFMAVMDQMSGITAVIDQEKWNRGMSV